MLFNMPSKEKSSRVRPPVGNRLNIKTPVFSKGRGLTNLDFKSLPNSGRVLNIGEFDLNLTSLLTTGLQTYGTIQTSQAQASAAKSGAAAAAAAERAEAARAAAARSSLWSYAKPVAIVGGAALAGWFLVRALRKGRR